MRRIAAIVLALVVATACSGDDTDSGDSPDGAATSLAGATPAARFPDILGAEATFDDGRGTWSFTVTVSSTYDTPERYADGWRVVGPDGEVYGVHTLAHDHADEQPFTRRQSGVEIPDGVDVVTIEGRDRTNGFGGGTVTVELSGGGA